MPYKDEDPNRQEQFEDLAEDTYSDPLQEESFPEDSYDSQIEDEAEWDESADDQEEPERAAQEEPKKKNSFMTYALIGAGALIAVVGGFALMSNNQEDRSSEYAVSNDQGQPQPASDQAGSLEGLRDQASLEDQLETTPLPTNAIPSQPQTSEVAEQPDSQAVDSAAQQDQVMTPGPSDVANVPPALEAPQPQPAPAESSSEAATQAPPAVLGGLQPLSDFPSVDQIKKSSPPEETASSMDATTAIPQPEQKQPAESIISAPMPTDTNELQTRLTAATDKIALLEKELLAAHQVQPASQPVTHNAEMENLRAKVNELEQKLSDKEKALNEALKKTENLLAQPSRAEQPKPAVEIPTETAARTPNSPVPSAAETSVKAAQAPKRLAPIWELRAAQPGQAVVGKKNGSDIRTVYVGDDLPGIGKITSIQSGASGWVIQGSQGKITQ